MVRGNFRQLRLFVLLCLGLFAIVPRPLQAQAQDPLTVTFLPIPPIAEIGPDGQQTGFLIELARLIGQEVSRPIDIVRIDSVQEFVEFQISGQSDMIAGVGRLPPLQATNLFSDVVASEQLRPIVLVSRAAEFEGGQITGARVGIVPPALGSQEDAFLGRNVPVTFESAEAAVMALLIGNVDVLLIPEPVAYSIARRAGADGRLAFVGDAMRQVDRFVALHESRADLLGPINAAIQELEQSGELERLRRQFGLILPAPPPDEVVVGVTHFPPYNVVNSDGTVTGFAVEVLRDLENQLGLTFRYMPITREQWQQGPGLGGYDMLVQTSMNPSRQEVMDFTLPIDRSSYSIFMRVGDAGGRKTLADLQGLRVAAQVGSVADSVGRATLGDDLTIVDTREELITGLTDGSFNAVLFSTKVFQASLTAQGLDNAIEAIDPPFHIVARAPALRFGLGALRDQLDTVIPGYILSDRYTELQQRFLDAPSFWSEQRLRAVIWSAVAILAVILAAFTIVTLRTRRRNLDAITVVRNELETIFNATSSGIIALDRDGNVVRVNDPGRHILGGISDETPFAWPKHIAFLDRETMRPLDASADPIRRILSGMRPSTETHLMRRPNAADDRRYVRLSHSVPLGTNSDIAAVVAIDDVSSEERNRQVVERKSRLDALGQLTGGIAHDFNNMLGALRYALSLAESAEDDLTRKNFMSAAARAVARGSSLTDRLLAFARKQPGTAQSKPVEEIFAEFDALIRPMLEDKIDLTFTCDEPNMLVRCDHTQLETALMNLVLNGRDAILRGGKGDKIALLARPMRPLNTELDDRQSSQTAADQGDYRYVELSVSDNGPGMEPEVLKRATDPFFTTKDSNSGTGLGLAMVFGFVQQAEGDLRLYSEPGLGTTVQLTLPRGTAEGPREARVTEVGIKMGEGETILLVEDDKDLLHMTTSILEDLGYHIACAITGTEAYQMVKEGLQFDLLLTDVVMTGGLGGFELAQKVRALHPDVPVIYTSGYTGFSASEMGEVQAPVMQKPVAPEALASKIAALLGANGN